ncbi:MULTISPECIES: hypothetical protein [unclassified Geodermatophilus]
MARSGWRDEDNGSFAPVRSELYETGPGFEPAEAGTAESTDGRHRRREPSEVPDAMRRPLAERIREQDGG